MNEQNIRKYLKFIGADSDIYDPNLYYMRSTNLYEQQTLMNSEEKQQLKPEEFCLYEKMLQGLKELHNRGVFKLVTTEKLSIAKSKFYKIHYKNLRKCIVCRKIIEEINLAPWNMTQNFLNCS